MASATASPAGTSFRGMARVGCRSSQPTVLDAEAAPGGGPIAGGHPGVEGVADRVAWMPRAASSRRERSLMVTCTQAGSSGGGGAAGEPIPLPGQVVMAEDGRSAGQDGATASAAAGLSGSEHRFSTTTRAASGQGVVEGARSSGGSGVPGEPGPGVQTGHHHVDRARPGHGADLEIRGSAGPTAISRPRSTPRPGRRAGSEMLTAIGRDHRGHGQRAAATSGRGRAATAGASGRP